MSAEAEASERYLDVERGRITHDMEAARARYREARARVVADDPAMQSLSDDIARQLKEACDAASAQALQRASAAALQPALTLQAITGGAPPLLLWLGLAIGWWLLRGAIGTVLATLLVGGGYVWLVTLGRGRKARASSRDERQVYDALAQMTPVMLAFDARARNDDKYPYAAVQAPAVEHRYNTNWRLENGKDGGHLGADLVELRDGGLGGDAKVMLRLPDDERAAHAVQLGDPNPYRWRLWQGVLEAFAGRAQAHRAPFHAFVDKVRTMNGHLQDFRLHEQRMASLQSIEQNWADVALPDATLDRIIKLVDLFKSGRTPAPKGMLLYGPPGTGKTLVARKLAAHAGCHFIAVGVADLKAEHIGATGPKVKAVWQKARENAPTLLFVDECESVFAARGSSESDRFSAELVQTFLAEWDGFDQSAGKVFVIGATNRRDLLDTAVMSRFTASIELGPPDADGRRRILAAELKNAGLPVTPADALVQATSGMSGRDLHTLAATVMANRMGGEVAMGDFIAAAQELRGKSSTNVERLGWDDVVLPDKTRAEFESLGKELTHAEELRKLNIPVPRGILLYGPPGTGKTQLARVLASQSGLSFLAATAGDLKGMWVGHSGNNVKQLFEKARAQAPCILFLDELDAIAGSRGAQGTDNFAKDMVNQLLQEMDGVKTQAGQVFLLAASNHPDAIDGALLSRLERKIEIGLPDEAARARILALQLKGKPLQFDAEAACATLAQRTEGLSGRDLQSLVTRATRRAVQRAIAAHGDPRKLSITADDLDSALADAAEATSNP